MQFIRFHTKYAKKGGNYDMSFRERFDSSEPIIPMDCIYGPPWCGKCKPEHCIFLMEYAFMPEFCEKEDNK